MVLKLTPKFEALDVSLRPALKFFLEVHKAKYTWKYSFSQLEPLILFCLGDTPGGVGLGQDMRHMTGMNVFCR